MQAFTHFSRHAFGRLTQRTHLSCEDVAWTLDQQLYANSGRIPGFDREHLVFWSAADQTCFVAIRDCRTGTVVTILPLEYHARIAWRISEADCEKARHLIKSAPPRWRQKPDAGNPTLFLVSSCYRDEEGLQKTKVLVKAPSAPFSNDIRRFLAESPVFSQVPELARAKGVSESAIFSLLVRLGNHSDPIVIDYPDIRAPTDMSPAD